MDADPTGIRAENVELKSDWRHTADMLFSINASPTYWRPVRAVHTLIRAFPEYSNLTEEQIVKLDNNYGRIARRILAGIPGFM